MTAYGRGVSSCGVRARSAPRYGSSPTGDLGSMSRLGGGGVSALASHPGEVGKPTWATSRGQRRTLPTTSISASSARVVRRHEPPTGCRRHPVSDGGLPVPVVLAGLRRGPWLPLAGAYPSCWTRAVQSYPKRGLTEAIRNETALRVGAGETVEATLHVSAFDLTSGSPTCMATAAYSRRGSEASWMPPIS